MTIVALFYKKAVTKSLERYVLKTTQFSNKTIRYSVSLYVSFFKNWANLDQSILSFERYCVFIVHWLFLSLKLMSQK